MHSHLDIRMRRKSMTLPDDFSISIEERNPLFYDTEMFSLPVPIPLEGNREFVKNIEVPQADVRPMDLEYEPVRIIADGMPFKSGIVKMTEGEDIRDSITLNVDASEQSFDDMIGDLECQDVPLKDKIQVGEKIGNVKVSVNYSYKVKVHYHSGKKDEWNEYPYEDDEVISGTFEPQALGFSYPGICDTTGKTKQVAVQDKSKTRTYPDNNTVIVPKVLTSFINVSDPYPEKPYCNARIAYLHHGLNEDGTTSDGLPEMDTVTGANEDHYPYWVLDADRPQSGLCFYVLYFLECLFTHLQVDYDLSALTAIEDFKHLCFFTTRHKYYTEQAHGSDDDPFFSAKSSAWGEVEKTHGNDWFGRTTKKVWAQLSEDDFNKLLFTDINTWLESRGCGGQFVLSYPNPKRVQDFKYEKNGKQETIIVGKNDIESITIEASVKEASVSANILSMFATSENFPEESVKTVLDSLENSFGIKFHYDYEQKKVTAYLLRDVFRNTADKPIDFLGTIHDMYKVTEKTTGVRMTYSAESEKKDQQKNVRRGVKDYDTDYDYIDYQADRTNMDLTYNQIIRLPQSQQKENLITYVDKTTGNTYRWKTSKDALESGEYKISLFQVATFKGVELGDCSERNSDNIKEFISDFTPVPFNDVNYRISELMVSSDAVKTYKKDGDTYKIYGFNSNYEPMLCAYIDEDMEHEFVPQYINNALPSAFVDIYLTEQLKLVESYDPSQTDDGNSPLQSIDWGLAIALMQGGGTNATIQRYDYNYDMCGNSRWRRVAGQYALTSDSMDMTGAEFDYNGDRSGTGGGERFSLKIRGYAPMRYKYVDGKLVVSTDPKEWLNDSSWLIPCVDDEKDKDGNITKKIRSRGLFDSFLSEYAHFLLNRKMFKVEVEATVAELNDITNHWKQRYRINGMVGWIGKLNYDITKSEGIQNAVLEFYAM